MNQKWWQLATHSPGQVEHCHQFPANGLGCLEALREEDNLRNLLVVRARHGHRPEQLLQVVW